jgi:septal ring factor EnvC (AmiA/AmiB activator)
VLRQQIVKLPSRAETTKQLEQVQQEIKSIEQDIASHRQTYEVRQRQRSLCQHRKGAKALARVSLGDSRTVPVVSAAKASVDARTACLYQPTEASRCHCCADTALPLPHRW